MFTFIKRLFSRSPVKRFGSFGLVHTRLVMPRPPVSRLVVPRLVASRPVVDASVSPLDSRKIMGQGVLQVDSVVFRRLSGSCFGDRLKAAGLVNYELSRDSGISRDVAIQRAYDRLMYDRSR